jgi:hypothetical protein
MVSVHPVKLQKERDLYFSLNPRVLPVRLLNREDLHDPDTIPEHDKECRVRVGDVHATNPITKVPGIPCSQRIFKMGQVFPDDTPVFFWQAFQVICQWSSLEGEGDTRETDLKKNRGFLYFHPHQFIQPLIRCPLASISVYFKAVIFPRLSQFIPKYRLPESV